MLFSACATPEAKPVSETEGAAEIEPAAEEELAETPLYVGAWTLVALQGEAIPEGLEAPNLTLGEDGTVSGFAGVNRLNGQAEISWDRKLGVGGYIGGPYASTMMAGEPAAMDLEAQFTTALASAASLRLDGENLVFSSDDKQDLLVFERSSE
jgi:heat shock protein HslJ